MGLWDKVKELFGIAPAAPPSQPASPEASQPAGGASQPAAPPGSSKRKPDGKPSSTRDPFLGGEILGLSPDELRKRALKINPYQTAWIGRTDTIPPITDDRTAIIDRGLILRGFLTEEQIREIHRVGDLWLEHHEAVKLATSQAHRKAHETIAALREEKARVKAEKKAAAAEREKKRLEAVAERKATDIVYLGRGVSKGLADRRANIEKLEALGLPVLSTPADVAGALGISIKQLRWLAFHAEAAHRIHYVQFEIPKRTGGTRTISAPHRKIAAAQRWILDNVLLKLPLEPASHGFVKGRSTVTNATPHVGRDVVVNLDLSSFFPTIGFPRVRGLFVKLGYSRAVATIFALLTTESPRAKMEYGGKTYWVALGPRGLPQGACTSPALSNQIARRLDRRLAGMSRKLGFEYTRYADDLTFSAEPGKRDRAGFLMARVRHVLEDEGFALNPKKVRVLKKSARQEVTGVVVNTKKSVPREEVRMLRAILHNAKKTGLAAQNRDHRPNFDRWLRGKIAYVTMIDREKGLKLLRELDALAR